MFDQDEVYKKFRTPPRKAISKKTRLLVAEKTNGNCGYCGIELPDRWHVDHIEPYAKSSSKCDIGNYRAACPQCNMFKGAWSLEEFRKQLSFQVENAREYSVNFRFAEKYGQIEVKPKPIIFYFEKLTNSTQENKS